MTIAVGAPEANHVMTQTQQVRRNAQPTAEVRKIAQPLTTHLNAVAVPLLTKNVISLVCRNWGMKNMTINQKNAEKRKRVLEI